MRLYPKGELNRILSAALQTRERQQTIAKIKVENREIVRRNMMLEQAKEMLLLAKQGFHSTHFAKMKKEIDS